MKSQTRINTEDIIEMRTDIKWVKKLGYYIAAALTVQVIRSFFT